MTAPGWLDGTWEHGIPRTARGIPDRPHRLRALGNAVIPQIPELLGRLILAHATRDDLTRRQREQV